MKLVTFKSNTEYPYAIKADISFEEFYASTLDTIHRWCYANFIKTNYNASGNYFYFRKEEDYNWFILRWS